ncbi:MAG: hypothetical protein A2W80_18220 [Candidatus Riflebacteria bacterium GWC2_50_8]|nr:MAG: hypothetical protein A2W80_18220 [Candidatus Riflebacteria bacterium GWC2_50_8]
MQARKITTLGILLRLLLLAIAISGQFSIKARYWNQYYPETVIIDYNDLLLQSLPAQLKSMGAGLLRLTADEYMHIGPYKKARQNFIAGSFGGNTEIMGLLKLALYLEPSHIETYEIMSQNLAMYLDRFEDAIRLIQQGILANRSSADLHKLYAAAAYCYGFAESYTYDSPRPIKNDRAIALNYLDAAIKSYQANFTRIGTDSYDVFANLGNYYVLKSRFLIDIGKKYEAFAAWQNVPAENRTGLIATYFSLMEQGIEVPDSPEKLFEQIFANQQATKSRPAPYSLPDGWYQTLFIDPAEELKAISSRMNRVSASKVEEFNPFVVAKTESAQPAEQKHEDHDQHNETSSCDHTDHAGQDCSQTHTNAAGGWTIFAEVRAAIMQAALMIVCGLGIRRFFSRR